VVYELLTGHDLTNGQKNFQQIVQANIHIQV